MPELILAGCSPEPLAGYLKALAVLRLVSEDAENGDALARAFWSGNSLRLTIRLGREELIAFFLERYRPSPILAPWNAGSGFYGGGAEPLDAIAASDSPRLAAYREAINAVRQIIPGSAPKDEDKARLLVRCRAELPDAIVPWLDACFVLGEEKTSFFPLLGTGGNDGRLDFTNNFMQRLSDVLPFDDRPRHEGDPEGWLEASLFGEGLTPLGRSAVGQFHPGGIGGPNGVQGDFEAGSRVNPWDFVLMIEGAVLFAGSVARRLGVDTRDRAAFPFAVQSVAVGYGSSVASEETTDGSRAELWLPLWGSPATLPEVAHLFGEGRAQFGRRQARNSVEFALAVNSLGFDRGIIAFQRYGFLKRNGLAFLATPLGTVPVAARPTTARLLDDPKMVAWLEHLRRVCRDKAKTPARYLAALRGIDRSLFRFATRPQLDQDGDRAELLNVLSALGRAERTLARGAKFCAENRIRPLQGLRRRWLRVGEDRPEFRLAAALASISPDRGAAIGPFRAHLEPVTARGAAVQWAAAGHSAIWTDRPLADNLAAAFLRRWMESERAGLVGLSLDARLVAPLGDVVAFLSGETDDDLLHDLLWGLIGLDPRDQRRRFVEAGRTIVPPAFALARLVVQPVGLAARARGGEARWRVSRDPALLCTTPVARPFHLLSKGDLSGAIDAAEHRLVADRLVPFGWRNRTRRRVSLATEEAIDATRLLAACLFPLSPRSLTTLARKALAPPHFS